MRTPLPQITSCAARSTLLRLFCVLILAAAQDAVAQTQATPAETFFVGVGNHLGQDRGNADHALRTMQRLGVNSFRDEVFWEWVESERGQLRWPARLRELERAIDQARGRGIEPLIILAYGNPLYHEGRYPISDDAQAAFARYAAFVVSSLKGRVRYYEVWNEWNGSGKASARDYVRLLRQAYPAIKRADPGAVVLGGAVEGAGRPVFIRQMMEHGALQYMDALSVHPYVFWRGTTQGTPEALLRWMEELQTLLRSFNQGRAVPVYVTEIGWANDSTTTGVSERISADYAAQTLLLLRSLSWVRGLWWYNLFDNGRNRAERIDNFGLITADGRDKPAFSALRETAGFLRTHVLEERLGTAPGTFALRFRDERGTAALAVFASGQAPSRGLTLPTGASAGPAREAASLLGDHPAAQQGTLQLSSTPHLIRGSAAQLAPLLPQLR
jgi:polysaccharide biosynthesis protein PslG